MVWREPELCADAKRGVVGEEFRVLPHVSKRGAYGAVEFRKGLTRGNVRLHGEQCCLGLLEFCSGESVRVGQAFAPPVRRKRRSVYGCRE